MSTKPLKDFRRYAGKISLDAGACLEKRHKMKLIDEGGALRDCVNYMFLGF